jgi:hypothetical protein
LPYVYVIRVTITSVIIRVEHWFAIFIWFTYDYLPLSSMLINLLHLSFSLLLSLPKQYSKRVFIVMSWRQQHPNKEHMYGLFNSITVVCKIYYVNVKVIVETVNLSKWRLIMYAVYVFFYCKQQTFKKIRCLNFTFFPYFMRKKMLILLIFRRLVGGCVFTEIDKIYSLHNDFNIYVVYFAQMTTSMFRLSQWLSGPFLIHDS